MKLFHGIVALGLILIIGTATLFGFSMGKWGEISAEVEGAASILGAFEVAAEPLVLTDKDIVNLVKPTVHRVVTTVDGEMIIPEFKIDPDTFEVSVLVDGEPTNQVIENYQVTGTGFFVDGDGHFVTNAHVVSTFVLKANAAYGVYSALSYDAYFDKLFSSDEDYAVLDAYAEKFQKAQDDIELQKRNMKIMVDAIKIEGKRDITILDPAQAAKDIDFETLTAAGFKAKSVYTNENFLFDGKDLSILKVTREGVVFPAVSLGTAEGVGVGDRIHAVGYPSTGLVGQDDGTANSTESTYSAGTISSLKDSDDGTFKFLQTDAKIASGSSGSPLINDAGEVIGIATSVAEVSLFEAGDSFAFGIPVDLVRKVLESENITIGINGYGDHMRAGITAMQNANCKVAQREFDAAEAGQAIAVDVYTDSYVRECMELIASGASIDTDWGKFVVYVRTSEYLMAGIGSLMTILFGSVLLLVLHFFHRRSVRRSPLIPQQV